MSSSKINITVNCNGKQKQELYSKISMKFEFQKDKLIKINNQFADICGTSRSPFLIFQMPTTDFKGIPITTFKDDLFEHKEIFKNNKLYHFGNFKSAENLKFIKNLQQEFIKLTELQNKMFLNVQIYDVDNFKKVNDNYKIWDKAKIKGQLKMDQKFMIMFKQILNKVSPKFKKSPLVVLLDLIDNVDVSLNLEKSDLISQKMKQKLQKIINLRQKQNKQFFKALKQNKQNLTVYLIVGNLFSLKIKAPSKTIGVFLQNM